MKIRHVCIAGVALALLGLLFGCTASITGPVPGDITTDTPAGSDAPAGSIHIALPAAAPYVARSVPAGAVTPQAFIIASSADIFLFDLSDNLVDSTTIYPATDILFDAVAGSYLDWSVPEGSYYIVVDIYNAANSVVSPVVSGTSADFAVTRMETTAVTVTCTPVGASLLTEGTASAPFNLPQNGEIWYSVDATSYNTIFTLTSTGTSDTGLYLFDGSGLLLALDDDSNPTNSVTVSTTPGSSFYLAVHEYGFTSDTFTVVSAPADDPYEENDSIGSSYFIDEATTYPGIAADQDWYGIYIYSGWEHVVIDLSFINSQGDIDLALYDSGGTLITSSAGTSDTEQIDLWVPTGGGYYFIEVYPYGSPTGNPYDLYWATFYN